MDTPETPTRRILVAACGMTPQIVTETLFALRVTAAQPFAVNEVLPHHHDARARAGAELVAARRAFAAIL